jgi:hypothetical protein
MTHKFSHPSIENLYIKALSDAELLKYFDEKSKDTSRMFSWMLSYNLDEHVFEELFLRERYQVDVALAKVASSEQANKIFDRNKKQIEIDGVSAFSLQHELAIALMGNPNAFGWSFSPSQIFLQLQEWLYSKADLSIFEVAINNLNVPQDMFKSILSRDANLDRVDDERNVQLLYRAWTSEKLKKKPEDSYDYDCVQHEILGLAWMSMLKVLPNKVSAFLVSQAMAHIAEFEVSWSYAKKHGFSDEGGWSQKAEEKYLVEFSNHWTPNVEVNDDNKSFIEDCYEVRVALIEKLGSYKIRNFKGRIFSFNDSAYRFGFYKTIEAYSTSIEELEKFYAIDGRKFLSAAIDNNNFYQRSSIDILLWLESKVDAFVEDEDLEVWEKLTHNFNSRFNGLGKIDSRLYFDCNLYEVESKRQPKIVEDDEALNTVKTSLDKFHDLKQEIILLSDEIENSPIRKLSKKYAELTQLISWQIAENDVRRQQDEKIIYSKIEALEANIKKYFLILLVVVVVVQVIF